MLGVYTLITYRRINPTPLKPADTYIFTTFTPGSGPDTPEPATMMNPITSSTFITPGDSADTIIPIIHGNLSPLPSSPELEALLGSYQLETNHQLIPLDGCTSESSPCGGIDDCRRKAGEACQMGDCPAFAVDGREQMYVTWTTNHPGANKTCKYEGPPIAAHWLLFVKKGQLSRSQLIFS